MLPTCQTKMAKFLGILLLLSLSRGEVTEVSSPEDYVESLIGIGVNKTMQEANLERAESWAERLANLPSQFLQGWNGAGDGTMVSTAGGEGCSKPANFPLTINVRPEDFINWSEQLQGKALWTAIPEAPEDVVILANWAHKSGFKLRPRGFMHSWAPLTVTPSTPCNRVLLVDTTKFLNKMRLLPTLRNTSYGENVVSVQTGAHWEELLAYLETKNMGIFSYPAVGKMSLGGTLAVGAHGTGLPIRGARITNGFRTGSISNLIVSLDAVVWDTEKNEYVLRTFSRFEDDTRAFLVHLGRAFITSVNILVDNNYNLRCRSVTTIKAEDLFSRDMTNEFALGNYVENYDRVEAQYFPYTDRTWLKLWTEEAERSVNSQAISNPYPYTHGRPVSSSIDRLIGLAVTGFTRVTPVISRVTYEAGVTGVTLTRTADVWGPSKNSLLYYHTLAHKFISLGFTVVTSRKDLPKVINLCYVYYSRFNEEMSKNGKYPMNQPLEFRITGLDKTETTRDGRVVKPPALSFLREVEGHPEYDVALFLGLHYFPGTPFTSEYMMQWESFLYENFNGGYATARVEWAKTWAFSMDGSWTNSTIYNKILPRTYGSEWNWAIETLNKYDPHKIYSNEFLDKWLVPMKK